MDAVILLSKSKTFSNYMLANKLSRSELFISTARSIIKNAKLFPDNIVKKTIIDELRNIYKINKEAYIYKDIFQMFKDFVEFSNYLQNYEYNYVSNI